MTYENTATVTDIKHNVVRESKKKPGTTYETTILTIKDSAGNIRPKFILNFVQKKNPDLMKALQSLNQGDVIKLTESDDTGYTQITKIEKISGSASNTPIAPRKFDATGPIEGCIFNNSIKICIAKYGKDITPENVFEWLPVVRDMYLEVKKLEVGAHLNNLRREMENKDQGYGDPGPKPVAQEFSKYPEMTKIIEENTPF